MLLRAIRLLFVFLAGALAWVVVRRLSEPAAEPREALLYGLAAAAAAAVLVCVDLAFRPQLLRSFVAVVFGIMLGLVLTGFVIVLVSIFLWPMLDVTADITGARDPAERFNVLIELLQALLPLVTLAMCYLSVSVVLRTKDQLRLIIPYVDFAEQSRSHGGILLDSSVLIDGRLVEVAEKLLLNDPLVVPHAVVEELQRLADSSEGLIRARGRRGLDMLARLKASPRLRVRLRATPADEPGEVDAQLVRLAKFLGARLATNDSNLAKVAGIEGVEVVNVNELASCLRVPCLPGEELALRIVRPGEQRSQGVGFLEDGTMVVVEDARQDVGREVRVIVTASHQTNVGRMIFGRKAGGGGGEAGQRS